MDAAIGPELEEVLSAKAAKLRAAGRRPYHWDRKRVKPIAAVTYALCLAEILDAMRQRGEEFSTIYVAATGSTGSGLALGKSLLGLDCSVGDVDRPAAGKVDRAGGRGCDIDVSLDYIGGGYGQVTPDGWKALDLLARTEGILLDPVYTAKAMARLIDDVRHRRLPDAGNVVFVHTGGQSAVFAYRDDLVPYLKLAKS